MFLLPPRLRFSVPASSVGLGLLLLALAAPSQASDLANSPSRSSAPRFKTHSAPQTPAAQLQTENDSLEQLRQRLAEKMGANPTKRDAKAEPEVVKLVNRADHAAPPAREKSSHRERSHSQHAESPMKRDAGESADKGQQQAARLAAAHRSGQAAGGEHALHWDYEGEGGPQAWGQLQSDFATCSSGKRQSPIDIRDGFKLELEPIQFSYVSSAIRVIDNGHTVQVNVASGSTLEVMGRHFELVQFHFHRPSEERIDGRRFDMVAHLVHKDLDGRLAVVAVLLSRGAAQTLIQTVWNNLPLEKGLDQLVREPVDLAALLPASRDYFTYMGSMTTPPCTEDVLWMVMKTPVEVSAEQIEIFSRLYPMNARPIQSASGRMIKESN